MRRRLNEEGSVYFDPTRNRYRVTARITDDEGTSKRLTFYGPTAAQALDKMRVARKRVKQGKPASDARLTLGTWLEEWSAGPLEYSNRKETTKDAYRYMLRHVQSATISTKELRRVLPNDLNKFFSGIKTSGLSSATIAKIFAGLKLAFKDETVEAKFLTIEQTRKLVEAAKENRLYVAIKLIAETGLRRGEALGLRWEDIDFEKGKIHVRHTLARSKNGLYLTPPKTKASRRVLDIAPSLADLLRSHKIAQDEEARSAANKFLNKEFIFATRTGEPVDPRNLQRSVALACKKAGLDTVGPHTLRHSAATTMLEAGVPIHIVSRILGHSKINITVDIYGHVSDEGAANAMQLLNKKLNS
jgi:integrase